MLCEILWAIGGLALLDYAYFKLRFAGRNAPPTLYGLPFVGLLPLLVLPQPLFDWVYKWILHKAPDVFMIRLLRPTLIVKNDAIREMQLNEHCTSRPTLPFFDLMAQVLVNKKHWVYFDNGSREANDWRESRRLSVAALYRLSRRETEQRLLDVIEVFLAEIDTRQGHDWDVHDELTISNIQASLYLTTGETLESKEIMSMLNTVRGYFSHVLWLTVVLKFTPTALVHAVHTLLPKMLRLDLHSRSLAVLVAKLQKSRRVATERDDANDFIEAVMRVKSGDETQLFLQEVAPFLIVANFHTSVATLSVLLVYLAAYPEYQKKVVDEIRNIVGTEPPNMSHYEKMHFTKAFIHERYRMLPPISYVGRLTTEPTSIGGYQVSANQPIIALFHSELWNQKNFELPERFRPERHLDGNGIFVKSPHVEPFSRGRRDCIGKRLATTTTFLYMVRLLQQFEVRSARSDPIRIAAFDGRPVPDIQPQKMCFVRRSDAPSLRPVHLKSGLLKAIRESFLEAEFGLFKKDLPPGDQASGVQN